jgi:hypothetical protein
MGVAQELACVEGGTDSAHCLGLPNWVASRKGLPPPVIGVFPTPLILTKRRGCTDQFLRQNSYRAPVAASSW